MTWKLRRVPGVRRQMEKAPGKGFCTQGWRNKVSLRDLQLQAEGSVNV